MKIIFLMTLLINTSAMAKKALKAHVHGHAKLDMAIDGKTLYVELKSPAESILGFEHEPKSAKEKQTVKVIEMLWKTQLTSFFQLPQKGCKVQDPEFKLGHLDHSDEGHREHKHEEHAEIKATGLFVCPQPIREGKIGVSVIQQFPKIKSLKVNALLPGKSLGKKFQQANFDVSL